jgi:TRAP-type C4-dicarboxylate transport system permease small subunit
LKYLENIERHLIKYSTFIAMIGLVALVILTLATIADVLFRWLMNNPIDGVYDLYKLIIAIVIGAFFPITLIEKHHISITFLGPILGKAANKWLNNFANVMMLVFLVFVSWELIRYVFELKDAGETTWILQWKVAPWWGIATFFMILCVPVQFFICIRDYLSSSVAN